jgi:hypothetical protein
VKDELAKGTLTIQRAIDVPQAGFKTTVMDDYAGGYYQGAMSSTAVDQDWYSQMLASGVDVIFCWHKDFSDVIMTYPTGKAAG